MIKYEEQPSITKNKSTSEDNLIDKIILGKYKLLKKLGKGSFGNIYLCKEISSHEFFAAKLENKSSTINTLELEYQIMNTLKIDSIPLVKQYGQNDTYNILIMQLLGKSLEQIFENVLNKQKMSIKCVCNLAIQMIEILEQIHDKNIIHRDIKPSNFLFGNDNSNNNKIYLIDFGLAKKFRESKEDNHYEMKRGDKLIGTARFASIYTMNGYSQSRRDDLESLGYVLIYFLKGKLPWQNILIKNKEERYKKINEIKLNIDTDILCSDCPEEFGEYITYIKNLKYEEDPNYNFIKNLFINSLNKIGSKFDYVYDWDNSKALIDINQFEEKDIKNEIVEDENVKLKLPLNKILYRKKSKKKRNKSQDKSTNDGREEREKEEEKGEESDEINNSSDQINLQNSNACCIIM